MELPMHADFFDTGVLRLSFFTVNFTTALRVLWCEAYPRALRVFASLRDWAAYLAKFGQLAMFSGPRTYSPCNLNYPSGNGGVISARSPSAVQLRMFPRSAHLSICRRCKLLP